MSGLEYTNNRWELDLIHNPAADLKVKKKQFQYHVWREDLINFQIHEDSKRSDVNLLWNEVYQLVGFFSVFQGVLFQGVSQLSAQLSCRFYKIPITLSVLASVATILGVHTKLSKVHRLRQSLYKDKLESKIRRSRISACENHGLGFNFEETERKSAIAGEQLRILYNQLLNRGHRIRIFVPLVALMILSGLFAWVNPCDNVRPVLIHFRQALLVRLPNW